jgi:hypothetical protein
VDKFARPSQKPYRFLAATTLLAGGIFQLAMPVFAEGTAAGTAISNTATATYEDPNNPNVKINATSNTVVVTVAEVAGITVTASGTSIGTDTNNDGKANVGDILYYDYTITNVGNDPTQFRIPNLAAVSGAGTVSGNLQVDLNGDGIFEVITGGELITASAIAPNASIKVRVPVLVQPGAVSGDTITVKLGETPSDEQNVARVANGGDVYTVDNGDTVTGEVAGVPVNGVREASATAQIAVEAVPQAFATVELIRTGHIPNDLTIVTDDVITYELNLKVNVSAPTGSSGLVPEDLAGKPLNGGVNSDTTKPYILVSSAIPAATDLAGTPTAPTDWTVVYTTDPLTTNANDATWSTIPPGDLSTVTRIGFVYDASTAPIAKGTTVAGFEYSIQTEPTFAGGAIAEMAQAFGTTKGVLNTLVYDESGDQNPSNFNDDGTVGSNIPTTGVADPTNQGIDSANNNTGTGAGGEDNVFTINPPGAVGILNGASGAADAIGSTSNDDDFTNKSTLVPPGTAPGSTFDPAAIGFANTVENTSGSPATISLLPTAPTNAADLPNGTVVTITYDNQSATYTYTNGAYNLTSGSTITILNVAPNVPIDYGVEVNLPNNTPLSTDLVAQYPGDTEYGFPVPVTAFVDTNGNGTPDVNEAQNTTIDRLYTGYVRMLKEVRVLAADGTTVLQDYTASPTTDNIRSGDIIEYRISYTNISTAGGTGNVFLNANKVVITEDGTGNNSASPDNNWGLDNDGNSLIDTSNIVGSAADSKGGNITFFGGIAGTTPTVDRAGTTAATDVTKYINTFSTPLSAGDTGIFRFQRKIN